MKIAVLGINYYPEVTGIAVYTTEMCEYLASKGHEICVITGFPYYPFGADFTAWGKKKGFRRHLWFLTEDIRGIRVKRCNLFKPHRPNTIKRILHEISFIATVSWRTLFDPGKYDFIICVSPPFLLGLVTAMVAALRRVPFIIHIQDLQPDAAIELGMIRNKMLANFLLWLEYRIYRNADYIMTISEAMRQRIIAKGIDEKKVGLLFNWADSKNIIPLDRKNSFSRRHHLDNKFVVMHAGNMGEKQDMHIILEAALAMKEDPSVVFLLVGRGTKRTHVEHFVHRHGLTNVLVLDVQPKGTLNEMFASCDVALITQGKNVTDCVMPSKVFGPACAEKPLIIAGREDCEISRLARLYDFGIIITPGDAAGLVAAIYHLKENRKLAENLGRNGRHFMVRDRQLEKVLDTFEENILLRYNHR